EHEELRPCGERPGDLEHALLAIGKCACPIVGPVSKADKGKKIHCLAAEPPYSAREEAFPKRHVLVDVEAGEHVLEQRKLLEQADLLEGAGDAEPRPLVRREPDEACSIEQKRTRVGLIDAGEEVQERRFAGAVRADQREDRACRDVDADVVHGAHAAEALVQLFGLEEAQARTLARKETQAWTMPPGMKSTTSV